MKPAKTANYTCKVKQLLVLLNTLYIKKITIMQIFPKMFFSTSICFKISNTFAIFCCLLRIFETIYAHTFVQNVCLTVSLLMQIISIIILILNRRSFQNICLNLYTFRLFLYVYYWCKTFIDLNNSATFTWTNVHVFLLIITGIQLFFIKMLSFLLF